MKNLLLCSVLLFLLAPGAVATAPAAPSESVDSQAITPSSACDVSTFSPADLEAEALAAWLDRIGAEPIEPDAAHRMSTPSCPEIQPCPDDCHEGEGPCFLEPLGSSECCSGDQCFQCEGGTEIFIITCPCLGAGCPPRSLELVCA